MPNALLNDIFRVTFNGEAFNQRIMFTMDYRIHSMTGDHDVIGVQDELLDILCASGDDNLESAYAACLSTSYTGLVAWAQRIYPTRMRKSELGMSTVGSAGASELTNAAAAVSLNTVYSGRRHIATKKIGPIATATTMVDNGLLTVAYKDLLALFANAALNTVNFPLDAIIMRPTVFHPTGVPPRYDDLTDFTIGQTARVNRRRTVGLGI